jgi:hypothetical protein
MRLRRDGAEVTGSYTYGGGSTIEGTVAGSRFDFRYAEPTVSGEGYFELSSDGSTLTGSWHEDGSSSWTAWTGTRVVPEDDVSWLIVIEAPWETSLAENEYAFGDMLRAYFERFPQVRVRHRRYFDTSDLLGALSELAYLAEPVALLVAGHGSGGMLTVNSDRIGGTEIGAAIRSAQNVFLVHFSSCEMMVGTMAADLRAQLSSEHRLAISGYAVAVDWSASALVEFLYLDLVLGRGMPPSMAAAVVTSELEFAGDVPVPGSPLGPAQFRFEGGE